MKTKLSGYLPSSNNIAINADICYKKGHKNFKHGHNFFKQGHGPKISKLTHMKTINNATYKWCVLFTSFNYDVLSAWCNINMYIKNPRMRHCLNSQYLSLKSFGECYFLCICPFLYFLCLSLFKFSVCVLFTFPLGESYFLCICPFLYFLCMPFFNTM